MLLNSSDLENLTNYYYEILLFNGLYDVTSNLKFFVKNMSQEKFKKLLDELKIFLEPSEKEELIRLMFDPDYRKYRKAVDGVDKITGSGTQFYGPEVTNMDIDLLPESEAFHRLSFPVKDQNDGKIKLIPIKLDGHYGPQLQRMDEFINLAKNYAYPEELPMIEAYQKAMKTGDPQDLYDAEVQWVRYLPRDIGITFYFVETYDDPRGRVATFQGGIYMIDNTPQARAAAEKLRDHAMDFEHGMPVNPRFKNTTHQKTQKPKSLI